MPGQRDIVINTGPLLALAAAEHLDVLKQLFGRVIVPVEVAKEIEVGGPTHFACTELAAAPWLERQTIPTPLSAYLLSTLDRGEAAVVAFALGRGITTVCIDETVGRRVARLHGLGVTGSLGILIQARQTGLNVSVRASIARMRQHGIWLSPTLEAEALRLAGE